MVFALQNNYGDQPKDMKKLVKYLKVPEWDEVNKYIKSKKIKTEYK